MNTSDNGIDGSQSNQVFYGLEDIAAAPMVSTVAPRKWQFLNRLLNRHVLFWLVVVCVVGGGVFTVANPAIIVTVLLENPQFSERLVKALAKHPDAQNMLRGPVGPQGPAGPPGPKGDAGTVGVAGSLGVMSKARNETCQQICDLSGKNCLGGTYQATNGGYPLQTSCDTPMSPEKAFSCECRARTEPATKVGVQ